MSQARHPWIVAVGCLALLVGGCAPQRQAEPGRPTGEKASADSPASGTAPAAAPAPNDTAASGPAANDPPAEETADSDAAQPSKSTRAASGDTTAIDDASRALLEKLGKFLEAQKTLTCAMKIELSVSAGGKKQQVTGDYSVALARPNRLALRLSGDEIGATLVSDGKKLYVGIPALKGYILSDAPESVEMIFSHPAARMIELQGQGGLLAALFSDHVSQRLLDRAEQVDDLGTEDVNDKSCRHLHFTQPAQNWDLWIEDSDTPQIRKAAYSMQGGVRADAGGGEAEEQAIEIALVYLVKDWVFHPELADDVFAIKPPDDWKPIEGLLAGGDGKDEEEEPSPLLGQPAPPLVLERLSGGKYDLAQSKDKEVVILDFWATWCGPCREALPTLIKVAAKYRDRGVVFYAVDEGEDPDDVKTFLSDQELDFQVLLDRDGEVGKAYKVEGIPQTVLVGKDGKVRVVHVGLLPNLEERLTQELDEILAVKNRPAATLVAAKVKSRHKARRLESAWTAKGRWKGVDRAAGEPAVWALQAGGELSKFDSQAGQVSQINIVGDNALLRTASLDRDQPAEFLTFNPWGQTVNAYAAEGKLLWSYSKWGGVDDVCAADLNGDGIDEVIIGYSGATGLHVLDAAGEVVWKTTDVGNVWHVTAGNVDGDEHPEVITTSAKGQVHIFDAGGNHLRDIDPGLYGHMVRTMRDPTDSGGFDVIVVAGAADAGEAIEVLDAGGKERWSKPLPAKVRSAATCPNRPWIAVLLADRTLRIFDAASGDVIAKAKNVGGLGSDVAWLTGEGGDALVVVAGGDALQAFSVPEKESDAEESDQTDSPDSQT